MEKINISLVDDEELILSLLSDFFDQRKEINLCCTARSGEEFLELLPSLDPLPDVIVLDLKMKKVSGLEVLEFLTKHYDGIKVIVMSSFYKKSFMGFMLKTGVSAFLPKNNSAVDLLRIIKEVKKNNLYFLEEQVQSIRDQVSSRVPKLSLIKKNKLTTREIEVLKLVCMQKTAKEIAKELFLTHRTVEGHKNNLFAKTSAKNNVGLVIYAIQNEYVKIEEIPMI